MDMTRKLAVRKRKCRSVLRSIPFGRKPCSKGLSLKRRSERRRSRKHAAIEKRLEIPKIPGQTRKIQEVSSGWGWIATIAFLCQNRWPLIHLSL